ncbi:hypothetical protein D9619_000033 [Psilocybe cf. subviscida]|uniref:CCHC-type domain-containing protein n=1 Tax=Psilocybe cf. subviscida TaxID=2480587 RepID=A0A8H5BD97_9AGAR|nr:hypothetical protein D9619_000033 [Psilocybe cf. subviscida]
MYGRPICRVPTISSDTSLYFDASESPSADSPSTISSSTLAWRAQPRNKGQFAKKLPQPDFSQAQPPSRTPTPDLSGLIDPENPFITQQNMPDAQPQPGPNPTPGTMPSRSSSSAPKFDGSSQTLKRFLDEVRDLATEKNISDAAAIKAALSYISSADYPAWSAQDASSGSDWNKFTKAIYDIYPGTAVSDRQYTKTDLNNLIRRTQDTPMYDQDDFGRYYRSFITITGFLVKKGRMGAAEQSERLLEGLPFNLRNDLKQYLRAKDPSHHTDDPWAMSTLYDAILFVLSNNNNIGTMSAQLSRDTEPPRAVKTEVFNASQLERYLESDAFAGKISSLMMRAQSKPTYQGGSSSAYTNSQPGSMQPGTFFCAFCSDTSHLIRECPTAAQYVRDGRCVRNDQNRLVLPGNIMISRNLPGKNMRERVDYWHHTNSPAATSQPSASGFLLQVAPPLPTMDMEYESSSDRETQSKIGHLEQTIAAAQAHISALKMEAVSTYGPTTRTRSYGNDESTRDSPPHIPAKNATAPASKPPVTKTFAAPTTPITDAKTGSFPPSAAITPTAQGAHPQPQYTYKAPVEDGNAVTEVVEQSMNTEVKLTNRQLLAMSSEFRKAFREQTTPKRIAANLVAVSNEGVPAVTTKSSVSALFAAIEDRTDGVVVAEHKVDLRAIPVEIPGAGKIEAVLDDGCQIVAISKTVWEKSGLALRSDHVMSMESANSQTNDTMGLLPDLAVTIGGHTFYVQCQVIDNAPYQMLLGRPFLTFTQASVRHFLNGDSHITLVDPNTQAVITIPTHARDRALENQNF